MTSKVVKSTILVPTEVDKTVFISCDGQEFDSEESFIRHEYHEHLKLKYFDKFQAKWKTKLYPEDYPAYIYKLDSDEAHDAFILKQSYKRTSWMYDDFEVWGPGYYLFVSEDTDNHEELYLYNLEAYQSRVIKEQEKWFEDVSDVLFEMQA